MILGLLLNLHKGSNPHTFILVARRLTTPWRAIYPSSIGYNPYHRIVVVEQFTTRYMLQPKTAVPLFPKKR